MKQVITERHYKDRLWARVQFSVSKEGIWTVQKVVLDHNHYLASPNKLHKLKS